MSNFNIDSGATDSIYQPGPNDPANGPHGIAEEDDTIVTDLEATEAGILDLAGRVTVTTWAPTTPYKAKQLALAPSGAYLASVISLVQAKTTHTSGSTFNAANWTRLADIQNSSSGLPSYKQTIGDGATKVFTVTHELNDLDVTVTVIDRTLDQVVYPTVGAGTDPNSVTVTFSVAPTANQMRVIVGAF